MFSGSLTSAGANLTDTWLGGADLAGAIGLPDQAEAGKAHDPTISFE
jgi:hypothetical protein